MRKEIARLCGMSRQTVSSALRALEKQGILYLEAGAGRSRPVRLTQAGEALCRERVAPGNCAPRPTGAVTVDVTSDDIKEVLDACLRNTSLGYYLQDDVVVIVTRAESIARAVQQESFKITGKVTDEKGESLPGVTIVIKGTTLGTATNETGDFTLDVPKMDSVVLVFSFVGMKSHTEVIRDLKQDMKPLKIVLEEEAETLKDVVVTGIFDRKKEGFTGSAGVIGRNSTLPRRI